MPSSTDDVFDALKPGASLLEYRIERILGQGGFGITYLARDTHLDALFAIKEFLPTEMAARANDNSVTVRSEAARESFEWAKQKFLAEAQVLARFSHPNLVRVSRFFEANGTVYFVMEFVAGQTLGDWLRTGGEVDLHRIESILLPLADGLAEVHAARVLHRDIKPGNIILRSDGSPILIDFGAARQSFNSASRSLLNIVSAGYAPVEQYSDAMPQGPWTDVYALGAVAYRMISGTKPLDAVQRMGGETQAPALQLGAGRLPPQLLAAVDWALAMKPDQRPQSLADWCSALRGEIPVPELPPLTWSESRPITTPEAAPATGWMPTQPISPPHSRISGTEDWTTTRPAPAPSLADPAAEPWSTTRPAPQAAPGRAVEAGVFASLPRRWLVGGALSMLMLAALWFMLSAGENLGDAPPADADTTRSGSLPQAPQPTIEADIARAEVQLAAGQNDQVLATINQRLAENDKDVVALVLRGHLAFARGARADGIADYALALSSQPHFSSNETMAKNLVSALGWVTTPAEGLIKTYTNATLLQELARRSLTVKGPAGRGHAYRILQELGEADRVDPLEFAKIELQNREECHIRAEAIDTIRRLGDASWIPLLEAQIPTWLTNICLRGPINQAVAELEKRPAPD